MSQPLVKRPNILFRATGTLVRFGAGITLFSFDYLTRIWLKSLLQFRLPWKRSSPSLNGIYLM
jgi:hypothetical protein